MHPLRLLIPFLAVLPIGAAEPNPSAPIPPALPNPPAAPQTLEALAAQALAENPELKFYEAEVAAARGERKSAGAWANPELSAEAGRKRVRGGGATVEGSAWALSVEQSFEWPGRTTLRKAIADRQVELAEAGLAQFKAALAAEVRRRGFAYWAASRRAEAAREVSERDAELVATLVQREPSGVAPLLEARSIEAAAIKRRLGATAAAQEAQCALFELNALRGRPIDTALTLSEPKLAFAGLPKTERLLREAATNNLTLRQRQIELAQQGFKVRLSENEAWPSITLGPRYSEEKAGERESVAGVGVSIPLPLWQRNGGQVEAARARELQAQASLRVAQREVERKVREAAATYELHRQAMALWHPDAAGQLREAAALAERHYRLGAVPLATYLEVQSSTLEALDAIYATQAAALQARADLELLTGSKLNTP